MPEIKVPQTYFDEAEGGGAGSLFPAGTFSGKIYGPSGDQENPVVEKGTPWDETQNRLRFSMRNNEGLFGAANPGERWFFVDITLSQGGFDWTDMPPHGSNEYWALIKALVWLADLAHQLGYTDHPTSFDAESFIAELEAGTFTGQTATFEVFHKKGKYPNLTPRAFKVR